jgi:hypothetical protein
MFRLILKDTIQFFCSLPKKKGWGGGGWRISYLRVPVLISSACAF